ncbi:LacI family DNA-binding transcriptional regulator [Actinocorallia populi]|uniref:LacI family DNA-binding transcriptional regulator n=1 Tax=Actinocorallia populi TaxID=2079200 RepID=UPI000D08EDFF|nr:LacI family DNA-binding transcriptional regulator [Actinocorallia populi]
MAQPGRPRRTTIADVARHAGVSTTAVSKVLRNAYGVSPAMRERVNAAIKELGYRPHAAARAMRGRTYTIGVVFPDLRNPFFPDILDGIDEQIAGTEYQVVIVRGGASPRTEGRAIDALVDRQVDGLLMVAPLNTRSRLEEVARILPTVVLGPHEKSAAYDSVADDDAAGVELVMAHLIGLGHRRIAHIAHGDIGRARSSTSLQTIRAQTYKRVMREHGLADEIAVATTSYTEEGGYEGTRELLVRDPRPTAIFAGADLAAFGSLAAVHEAGLSVPGDVSVVGYDDTRMAALANISLTSVDQDGLTMGRTVGRLLLERIEGRTTSVQFAVSPALVPRRSTGRAPA